MGLLAKQEITLVFLDVRVKRSPFVCVYNNVGLFYTTPSMFGLFFLTYVFFSSKNSYYYLRAQTCCIDGRSLYINDGYFVLLEFPPMYSNPIIISINLPVLYSKKNVNFFGP